MEGSPGPSDLRTQLKEREAEVRDLRDQLSEAQEEIDRLRRENEQLRKELKAAGRGKSQGQSKRKKKRKRSGRKAGKGRFAFRSAPAAAAASGPPQPVPVTITQCPCCGGQLRWERTEDVTVTDMPERPQPEVKCYAVEVRRCEACGRRVRGQHPDVEPDQYGATAHRVGQRVKAAAHAVHYGMGVPVRKVPAILREFTGVEVTQSALTQDALKKSTDVFGLKLKKILGDARQLWRDQRAGKAKNFPARAEKFEQKLTYHLRHRLLKDEDNQRLLDGIGLQHDQGRVLRFLRNPAVEPTNNRSERALRPAVIARKLPHGSKNISGAEAFSAFTSVIQTAVKRGASSTFDASHNLFGPKTTAASSTEAHAPPP